MARLLEELAGTHWIDDTPSRMRAMLLTTPSGLSLLHELRQLEREETQQ